MMNSEFRTEGIDKKLKISSKEEQCEKSLIQNSEFDYSQFIIHNS